MAFKKGSKEAKAHMAKLRAKRKAVKVNGWRKGGTVIIEANEKPLKGKKNVRVTRQGKSLFPGIVKPGTFKKFSNVIAGLFDTSVISDIDQLKKEYYKLAKKYHPDAGGTKEQFQLLQAEYEKHLDALLKGSKLTSDQQQVEKELDEALRNAANQLVGLPGITIELVGKWLWIGGNTYPIRSELKQAGFMYASNKKMWFYKGTESKGRGNMDIEEIRAKYGSKTINPKDFKSLNGIGSVRLEKSKRSKLLINIKRATKALNKRAI